MLERWFVMLQCIKTFQKLPIIMGTQNDSLSSPFLLLALACFSFELPGCRLQDEQAMLVSTYHGMPDGMINSSWISRLVLPKAVPASSEISVCAEPAFTSHFQNMSTVILLRTSARATTSTLDASWRSFGRDHIGLALRQGAIRRSPH